MLGLTDNRRFQNIIITIIKNNKKSNRSFKAFIKLFEASQRSLKIRI